MKNIDEFVNESASNGYLNKTEVYLVSIPYLMYKEFKQYKEDWEGLDEQAKDDVENAQHFLDGLAEDDRVRINYKKLAPQVKYGMKAICEIALKHEEDLSKLDIKLFNEILKKVSE